MMRVKVKSKRWLSGLALLLIGLSTYGHSARALSCAPPEMDADVFSGSVAIFIGRMVNDRPPSKPERQALEVRGLAGIDPDKIRLFGFSVSRAWKGVTPGQRVIVARDTYWGDSFSREVSYLVVAESSAGDILITALCGNTQHLDHAGPQIERLESITR
jgi:hypothetical protein